MTSAPAALDFAVSKRLGDFSLEAAYAGGSTRLSLLGASGAGKTLVLRLLAGLATPAAGGHVRIGRRSLDGTAAEHREIGYVPQHPALLPRRTVWRQVMFGVRAQPRLAAWWIECLGLSGLEDRYPQELSGGQQRRVALARALAVAPAVLLLDEPFTGLDAPVRDRLRRELRRLQRELALNTVLVTHDPEEAALMSDELLVLDDGHVLQAGPREGIFDAPASPRVAALLGIANTHRGRTVAPGRMVSEGVEIEADTRNLAPDTEVVWSVRPEQVLVAQRGRYGAILLDVADLGAVRELTVALGGALELTTRTHDKPSAPIGSQVRVALAADAVSVWPAPQPATG